MNLSSKETIKKIFTETKTIAVVGLSPKNNKASNQVSLFLKNKGYKIIPVNPGAISIFNETCYSNLLEITEPVDLVLIFRRSEFIPPIVDAAIKIEAKFIWMQEGIIHEEAAQKAHSKGIEVIMDRCMYKEYGR